jgi:hypothetical protein
MASATAVVAEPESTWKRSRMRLVARRPPSANTSPWAKLISWRMPYTSV